MKKLILPLLICIASLSLTSCITEAYAETYPYDDDVEIIIQYGTPYYYGNTIAYYYYNGYYFYPYKYNNSWRFHRYSKPLPPPRHHPHYGHHATPHHNNGHHATPPRHHRPNNNYGHHTRPPRNNTGSSRHGGHFGGRRR